MANYSEDEWESIGTQWRKAAGLDDQDRFDAVSFVRWPKQSGYIKDYICVPDADLPMCEGKYEPDEGRIYYRSSSWRGAQTGNPHHSWTVVHEASHAILKHSETRLRASNQAMRSRRGAADELDANRLTASILAPFARADFTLGMTVDQIAKKFGISIKAAEKRIQEFEKIFRRRNGISRSLPPGILDFLKAQKRKGYKVSNVVDATYAPVIPSTRYEGEACPNCGEFKLVRFGLRMKCDCCSAETGED